MFRFMLRYRATPIILGFIVGTLITLIILATSCSDVRGTEYNRGRLVVDSIEYVRDHRTDECFAVVFSFSSAGWRVASISAVNTKSCD